jgi:hypothetical protein
MGLCRRSSLGRWRRSFYESLELRTLLSAAFDVTSLTALRADPAFSGIDGSDLSVAVLDTGLFASHQDISGNFLRFFDAVNDGAQADLINSGTANPAQAFDPPGEGHGTHVAGTVGSTNPAIGVATDTNLISVRVLTAENEAQPQINPLVAGLEWVRVHQAMYNIRVVNMSLGSQSNFNSIPNKDDVGRLIDQLEALGVTVVSAAGNSYGGYASLGESYPAVFSTIAVANTWEDSGTAEERDQITLGQGNSGLFGVIDEDPNADQFSASSQRSTLSNLVAAPGTTIFSTWNNDGGLLYNTIAGTSMASPFVAGTVALMQDAAFTFGGRYLTPDEVLTIIKNSADNIVDSQDPGTARFRVGQNSQGELVQTGPIVDLPESGLTYKRVNAYNALKAVRELVTGGATPNPQPAPDPGSRTDDTNNTLAAATGIPSLNGLNTFDFTGAIGTDGDVNVGSADIDLYRINLDAPGVPVFTLNPVSGGQSFDPLVRLFDANGNAITAEDNTSGDLYPTLDTATKLSSPLSAGTYYIGVSSTPNGSYAPSNASGVVTGNSTGDYRVTIGLTNPDPNGVIQGALDLDLTNPDTVKNETIPVNTIGGTIGDDQDPAHPEDPNARVPVGAQDVDVFAIVAPDTGQLTIDLNARDQNVSNLDTYVAVYQDNPGGEPTRVGFNDDENYPVLLDALLTVNVSQGTRYFVAITTFQNSDFSLTNPFDRQSSDPNAIGRYTGTVSFSNGDVNGSVLSAVDFGTADGDGDGVVQGTIGADFGTPLLSSGTNGGSKDVDFFTLIPQTPGLLNIDATGEGDFDGVLGLWELDDNSTLVAIADTNDTTSKIGIEITDAMVNHRLYISVTGSGNSGFSPFAVGSGTGGETGSYSISITQQSRQEFLNQTNDSIQSNTPEEVAVGEPLRRDIGRDGTIDVGADDIDIYHFVSPFTGTLQIRTDTSDEDSADTFLRAFDTSGNEIASNNNISPNSTASLVSISVTTGTTYYFGVNGASAQAGNYNALTGEGAAAGSTGHYVLTLEATDSDIPLASVSDAQVTEVLGQRANATFTITLNEPVGSGGGSVTLTPTDGSANAGSDFIGDPIIVSFAPGATSATAAVPVLGDFNNEDTETFAVNLSNASGLLIVHGQGTGTITNTAAAAPQQFAGKLPLTFTPPGGGAPVVLTLKGQGTGSAYFVEGSDTPALIVLDATTPSTTLTIKGVATLPSLTVNGSLKSLGSKTTSLGGDLNTTGSIGKITFANITNAHLTLGDGVPLMITAGTLQDVSIASASAVKSIKVTQWLDTDGTRDVLSADSVTTLSAKGAFQADVDTSLIGRVTVGGAVSGSNILADLSIGTVSVGSIADSAVIVGNLSTTSLPTAASDFGGAATSILSFTVKSKAPAAFSDTLIAAANLGKVTLSKVATSNSGSTFGVAALAMKSVSATPDTGLPIKQANLDDPSQSVVVSDFVVRLL